MTGALKYIYQQFPVAYLSEVKFIQSANGIAQQQFDQEGARYIYYNYIYIALPAPGAGGPSVITFNDQYGAPLFSCFNQSTSGVIYAPLFYVKPGSNLKISCTDNTIQFSVSYQYVISSDDVNLKVRK